MKLRVVLVGAFLFSFLSALPLTSTQSQTQSGKEPGGSILGKVTVGGTPVRGALVVVWSASPIGRTEAARGKTNASGQYRITNLAPGNYTVIQNAPPLAAADEGSRYGRELTLDPGETRENVDFSLARGGTITGRISDASGRPLVEEHVILWSPSTGRVAPNNAAGQTMMTDDRGVYRVFGLLPGRYRVSVGMSGGSSYRRLDHGEAYYPLTYYAGVSADSEATLVEVTEGGEASGIDIVVGPPAMTFEASGLIVDAETGKPQPGINWGYGGNAMSTFGRQSDSNGGFKISGLMPGRYSVFAGCEGDYFMDAVNFEVTDRDITGLEIRRHRGASISGKVAVEGVSDPAVLDKLKQVSVRAGGTSSNLEPDGFYYLCGLRPGRVKISAGSMMASGFWLLRVERDGVDLREGIDVSPGDHVTNVRVVLGYATGVIRGQVTVTGGDLPEGVHFQIQAHRLGAEDRSGHFFVATDERGRFVIEGLRSGEYELTAGSNFSSLRNGRIPRIKPVTQRVIVTDGTESKVNVVLEIVDSQKPANR